MMSFGSIYHYAECRYAESRVLFTIMPSVIMLSVVAPLFQACIIIPYDDLGNKYLDNPK
jgi:hypothetical protein